MITSNVEQPKTAILSVFPKKWNTLMHQKQAKTLPVLSGTPIWNGWRQTVALYKALTTSSNRYEADFWFLAKVYNYTCVGWRFGKKIQIFGPRCSPVENFIKNTENSKNNSKIVLLPDYTIFTSWKMDIIQPQLWEMRVILLTCVGWRFKKNFEFLAFKTHKNRCNQKQEKFRMYFRLPWYGTDDSKL